MFETKVIVAPNSPSERAKARIMPATMPGRIRGNVMVANTQTGLAPKVPAAASRRRSTASTESRIARTGQGRAGPAKGEDDAEPLFQQPAERTPPAEQQQQDIAGDDRRHDQRQVNDDVQQRAAPEPAAGEQKRHNNAEWQAAQHRPESDLQGQPDRGPFLGRKGEEVRHRFLSSMVKPYFSNCRAASGHLRSPTNGAESGFCDDAVTPIG